MRARRSAEIAVCMGSVGETFFDCEFRSRKAFGDTRAGTTIAVEVVARRLAALQVLADAVGDGRPIVLDVDHVAAALPALLPRADVHRRHAQVGALADRDA